MIDFQTWSVPSSQVGLGDSFWGIETYPIWKIYRGMWLQNGKENRHLTTTGLQASTLPDFQLGVQAIFVRRSELLPCSLVD